MATPLGHSVLGMAAGGLACGRATKIDWRLAGLFILAGNAPDLDFVPGLLVGDINRFHQGASHSFAAAAVFALITASLAPWFRVLRPRIIAAVFAAYVSHLIVDLFCRDARLPYGIPLLWPFDAGHFASPLTVFSGIRHGVPGDSLAVALQEILSPANLAALGMELAVMLPILIAVIYWRRT